MEKEVTTKILFIGNKAEDYFINNKEKLSKIINNIIEINNENYEIDIVHDFRSIHKIEVQHILIIDSDDDSLKKKLKCLKALNIFTVIDVGLDKSGEVEKCFMNENIIKTLKTDKSLDYLIFAMADLSKPPVYFGDMSSFDEYAKERLGYKKYKYKKIDKVSNSIKDLEDNIIEISEKTQNIFLLIFICNQSVIDVQEDMWNIESKFGDDKRIPYYIGLDETIEPKENINVLLLYS